jgi:hypothetical protein
MSTEKQEALLLFIARYRSVNYKSPNLQEMCAAIGAYDHRSVIRMLDSLEREGLIYRANGKHRSVNLTHFGAEKLSINILPMRLLSEEPALPKSAASQSYTSGSVRTILPTSGSSYIPKDRMQSFAHAVLTGQSSQNDSPTLPYSLSALLNAINPVAVGWLAILGVSAWFARVFFSSSLFATAACFLLIWLVLKISILVRIR